MIATTPKRVLGAQCLFFVAILLLADGAYAEGAYQRTKDGKTFVWNPDPKPGDAAAWSGDRDAAHYATGSGTLTWYKIERKFGMGSRLPIEKESAVIQYSGKMVRGRLDGLVVAVDANGQKLHAMFSGGNRSGEWVSGPAPKSDEPAEKTGEPVHQDAVAEKPAPVPSPETESRASNAASAVARPFKLQPPTSSPIPEHTVSQRADKITSLELQVSALSPEPTPIPEPPAHQRIAQRPAKEMMTDESSVAASPSATPSSPANRTAEHRVSRGVSMSGGGIEAEDLLRSMVIPPSTIGAMMKLRNAAAPQSSIPSQPALPPALPRLSTAEVIALADAEARKEGYELDGYQCSKVDYTVADDAWSVMYDQKPVEGMADAGKHFIISVADKTKKTSIATGK